MYYKLSSFVIRLCTTLCTEGLGGTGMSAPSSLVSLRITDEELALLDARIGIEGARNRSDVIRMAIRDYLHEQPLLQDLDQVKVTIGRKMKLWLAQLYETQGITAQIAAQQGLQSFVREMIEEDVRLSEALAKSIDDSRNQTMANKDFKQ